MELENEEIECSQCKRKFPLEECQYEAYDIHKNLKLFCSKECLKSWVIARIIGMCATVGIGFLITLFWAISEKEMYPFIVMFVPYILRQNGASLKKMFNSGTFGEFFSFMLVLLGSITFVYPLVKLIQEIRNYVFLKKTYDL